MNGMTYTLMLASCLAVTSPDRPATPVTAIHYDHAGLETIDIENGRLDHVFHTLRRDLTAVQQSMESYDRFEAHISLTDEEIEAVRSWIRAHNLIALPATFPDREGAATYGSAFCTSPTVALDDRKHSISWTGDSKVPDDVGAAVTHLGDWCAAIRRGRVDGREGVSRAGRLGHPLGTYLTIEGLRVEQGKVGTQTLRVDTVNGVRLASPTDIWVEGFEQGGLPPNKRCIIGGYESGRMIGVPRAVAEAEAEGTSLPQAVWQFWQYFVMTSVVQPESPQPKGEAL